MLAVDTSRQETHPRAAKGKQGPPKTREERDSGPAPSALCGKVPKPFGKDLAWRNCGSGTVMLSAPGNVKKRRRKMTQFK